jgi:uncharacterized membrane protein (UPF0127 family)
MAGCYEAMMQSLPLITLIEAQTGLRVEACHATRFLARTLGLLTQRTPPTPGTGLLLDPGGSVHTLAMRYAIDCAFLTRHGRVLHLATAIQPNRLALAPRRTQLCLETRAGGLPQGIRQFIIRDL